jgi:hypothetical protein
MQSTRMALTHLKVKPIQPLVLLSTLESALFEGILLKHGLLIVITITDDRPL